MILLRRPWSRQPPNAVALDSNYGIAHYALFGGDKVNIANGRPTLGSTSSAILNGVIATGRSWQVSLDQAKTNTAIDLIDSVFPSGSEATVVLSGYTKTAAGHGFLGNTLALNLVQIYLPFVNGTLYFRWGTGDAEGEITCPGLIYSPSDTFVLTTGSRGMQIWQNGVLRASNAKNPTRVVAAAELVYFGTISDSVTDAVDMSALVTYPRQFSNEVSALVSREPWRLFVPQRQAISSASAVIVPPTLLTAYADQITTTGARPNVTFTRP